MERRVGAPHGGAFALDTFAAFGMRPFALLALLASCTAPNLPLAAESSALAAARIGVGSGAVSTAPLAATVNVLVDVMDVYPQALTHPAAPTADGRQEAAGHRRRGWARPTDAAEARVGRAVSPPPRGRGRGRRRGRRRRRGRHRQG